MRLQILCRTQYFIIMSRFWAGLPLSALSRCCFGWPAAVSGVSVEIMLRMVFPIMTVPPPSFLAASFDYIFP